MPMTVAPTTQANNRPARAPLDNPKNNGGPGDEPLIRAVVRRAPLAQPASPRCEPWLRFRLVAWVIRHLGSDGEARLAGRAYRLREYRQQRDRGSSPDADEPRARSAQVDAAPPDVFEVPA